MSSPVGVQILDLQSTLNWFPVNPIANTWLYTDKKKVLVEDFFFSPLMTSYSIFFLFFVSCLSSSHKKDMQIHKTTKITSLNKYFFNTLVISFIPQCFFCVVYFVFPLLFFSITYISNIFTLQLYNLTYTFNCCNTKPENL